MTEGASPVDDLTPAERRLSEHLEVLRVSPPTGGPELVPRVIRTVRWQRAIRDPLALVGAVAAAIAEGLGLVLSRSSGDS
jgi:hypothetical protein